MKYEETRLSGWILTIRWRSLITKKAQPQFFWTGTLVLRRVLENTVEIRARKLQANWKWSYVVTKEENVAIFRRYIAEISCVEGYRHEYLTIYRVVNAGQRGSTKVKRATVPVTALQCCYSASPFACCREDLNPKPKGLGFTRLPPGLTCPLIHNMQQIYIYLNSLYKENIRIF